MTEDASSPIAHEEVRRRLDALVGRLAAAGALRTETWRSAILETPRHIFVPHFFWIDPQTGVPELVDVYDPRWLDGVYSDEPLITQFGGSPDARSGVPTSSSTAPDLMVRMLEALDLQDDHRVLEIGTGTGYNAALLCHRVGDSKVTTIDIDESVCADARRHLAELDLHPTVIRDDGVHGCPARGPYDRIIATCSVPSIPPTWLHQMNPGGRIMATIETGLHGYGLALLEVDADGRGKGRILDEPASFMPLRTSADATFAAFTASAPPASGSRRSNILFSELDSNDARFALGVALPPGLVSFGIHTPEGDGIYLGHPADHSWAELKPDGTVVHGGPRDLWTNLEVAHDAWVSAGRPPSHQFEITATERPAPSS